LQRPTEIVGSADPRLVLPLSTLLVVLTISPPARADIVYTWHETDGQNVTGSLDVSSQALVTSSISFSDIESFSFITPTQSFSQLLNTFIPPVPIGSSGVVTAPEFQLASPESANLILQFDAQSFNPQSPIFWDNMPLGDGQGFWSVTNSVVPEPSSILPLSIGAVSGIACCQVRQRRAQRRRPSADQR
jgi:hypothetical protein